MTCPAGCLGQDARAEPEQCGADRGVDEEAPAPGRPFGEHAAEKEAEAAARARDGTVEADRARPLPPLGEARSEERERGGSGDRGADALEAASDEEHRGRGGEPADDRGGGEEADPDAEEASAAKQIASAGAEQQQAAEGERVGVLNPAEAGRREVQRAVDAGQRRDHDRGVEDDHQVRAENQREDQGWVAAVECDWTHYGGSLLLKEQKALKWRRPPKYEEVASA